MRQTTMAKPNEVKRQWYVVDATDCVLGRLASQVATVLKGKNKPIYTPNVDCGDHVIVINCKDAVLTGRKGSEKIYFRHTGWIGHAKKVPYGELLAKNPTKLMELAVSRMVPNNTIGRKALTRLHLYSGAEHKHEAQKPEQFTF